MVKFLIRFFIFLSLLCSFAFSGACSGGECSVIRDNYLGSSFKLVDGKFLKGNNYFGIRRPETGYYYIYSFTITQEAYYFLGSKTPGFYDGFGYGWVYIGGELRTGRFGQRPGGGIFENFVASDYPKDPIFNYYDFIVFVTKEVGRCSINQEFNTDTMQCVDTCPAGQAWDVDINACVNDCTDKNLNKFGYFNGTTQGKCVDCSNAYSDRDIATCLCTGLGSSFGGSAVFVSDTENLSIVHTVCGDDFKISFKRRSDEDPNKDKENPKPDKDKDKKNDNNSTNSSDKDKENPDKKDNNESSNNSSGESGNPSNNNSGGSAGNGSSGGGGAGVETKPNPNHNGNGKEDGKSDGKGEEGKGDDNIGPAKLDYEGLKASSETFEGQFKTAIDDSFSFVNDVKASLTDTLQKIKDGNLMSLKKGAVPTTCPLSFQIDMTYFSKNLTFDFCKIVSPVSSSLYILFYLAFFILFLVVTIKLFILTFMGW